MIDDGVASQEGVTPRSPRRVRVPARFTVMRVAADEYRLHSLTHSLAVKDDNSHVVSSVLSRLQSPMTLDELTADLASLPADMVRGTVEALLRAGVLEVDEGPDGGALAEPEQVRLQSQINFFSHFTPPADVPPQDVGIGAARTGPEYQARLKNAHVVILGAGRLGSLVVRDLVLAGVGSIAVIDSETVEPEDVHMGGWFDTDRIGSNRAIAVCEQGAKVNTAVQLAAVPEPNSDDALESMLEPASLAVLVTDRVRRSQYLAVNRAALRTRTRWTSGRLSGFEFHLGPTVLPHETACWACADLRRKSNMPDLGEVRLVESYLENHSLRTERLATCPGAPLVVIEVIKALTMFSEPVGYSNIYTFDLVTFTARRHPVLRIPRCPACGRPSQPRPTVHAWQQGETPVLL